MRLDLIAYLLPFALAGLFLFLPIAHAQAPEPMILAARTAPTIEEKILAAFPDAPVMLAVARCESGNGCRPPLNPEAKNPESTAKGLFQILNGTWVAANCAGDVFDEDDNIACARILYDDSGLSPWEASRSGWGRFMEVE